VRKEITAVAWIVFVLLVLAAAGVSAGPEEDYEKGRDAYLKDDVVRAMGLLEASAAEGYTPAQVLLAEILDKAEEDGRAFELYTAAAANGSAAAELGLGGMYASGEGVERDYDEARMWITRSAEQGHGPAMVLLAVAYQQGKLGLEVDPDKAKEWLEKAAASGYEPARQRLDPDGEGAARAGSDGE